MGKRRKRIKMARGEAGRLGGLVTLQRYGRDQLAAWGKRGGRPRAQSYDEIRQQQRLERNNNNHKEVMGPPGANLRMLKARLKLSQRSTDGEIVQAGISLETPRGESLPKGVRTDDHYKRRCKRHGKV